MQFTATCSEDQLVDLLMDVADRDATAPTKLWRRLEQPLKTLAKRELYGSRPIFDEDDIALIVFTSFCRCLVAGNDPKIKNYRQLLRYLTTTTRRVVIDLYRHQTRQRRGGLEQFQHGYSLDRIEDCQPGPATRAGHDDELNHLIQSLDATLGDLLSARLDGKNHRELATMFGCSVRNIERRMKQLRSAYKRIKSGEKCA